jgi:hypothetical protein
MWWHAKDHPVWQIAKIAALAGLALTLSWVNASSFDVKDALTAAGSFGLGALGHGRKT